MTEEGRADREPSHEGSQHRGKGVHRVADDQAEHAQPYDLVDEGGCARQDGGCQREPERPSTPRSSVSTVASSKGEQ